VSNSTNSVDYHTWQSGAVVVQGRRVRYATKPGAFAHGAVDPAMLLLAEHVRVESGEVVVHLNCGAGIFSVVAAGQGASRLMLSDRNVVSHAAASRTLAVNDVGDSTLWLGHGTHGLMNAAHEPLGADLVAIRIPHEKLALLQLLRDAWHALRMGGRCVVVGATNEGIKSAARMLERIFGAAQVLAGEGGYRLVQSRKQHDILPALEELAVPYLAYDAFHELTVTLRGAPHTLFTRPGVFSWEHLDEATGILADVLTVPVGASVLDLGCGSGALGLVAAQLSGGAALTMVDADVEAVRSAQRTAGAAGLVGSRAMASDIGSAVLHERFDMVVSNPPFHIGKATALNVPTQFMRDAHTVLNAGGRLMLVANRTLPYEGILSSLFGNCRTVHDGPRFKVLQAEKAT